MRGVNKVVIVGALGADPETRSKTNGGVVANISVATTEKWRDRNTGELKEETEWHRIVLFNKLAEITQNYLRKGSKVYIEGRLKTRKWQDQNGIDRYTPEIIANDMQMLDSMPNLGHQPRQPQQGGYQGNPQQAAPQRNQQPQQGGYQGGQPQHVTNPYNYTQ